MSPHQACVLTLARCTGEVLQAAEQSRYGVDIALRYAEALEEAARHIPTGHAELFHSAARLVREKAADLPSAAGARPAGAQPSRASIVQALRAAAGGNAAAGDLLHLLLDRRWHDCRPEELMAGRGIAIALEIGQVPAATVQAALASIVWARWPEECAALREAVAMMQAAEQRAQGRRP